MKKIILAIMCVVIAVTMLAACGRENVGDYTEKPTQGSTTTTTMKTTTKTTTMATTENNTTGVLTPTTSGESTQGSTTQADNG